MNLPDPKKRSGLSPNFVGYGDMTKLDGAKVLIQCSHMIKTRCWGHVHDGVRSLISLDLTGQIHM